MPPALTIFTRLAFLASCLAEVSLQASSTDLGVTAAAGLSENLSD
jgi:hypothetical protein